MKIALIADTLTQDALSYETNIKHVTPLNYKLVLKFFKPDFLFVESVWQGYKQKWKYKVAAYPDHPKRTNKRLQKVVAYAKKLGIPTLTVGDAVYDIEGLTSKGRSLNRFWEEYKKPDPELYEKFRNYLIENSQLNGSFYGVIPKEFTDTEAKS